MISREKRHPDVCPRCLGYIPNNESPGAFPGARSRAADVEICSMCGQHEALVEVVPVDKWPVAKLIGGGVGQLTAHTSYDALRYYNPRPLKPWLLEVTTDDGEGFHSSDHDTADEARARRLEVLAEWHAKSWGQDPAVDYVSPKAIHSCITDRRAP